VRGATVAGPGGGAGAAAAGAPSPKAIRGNYAFVQMALDAPHSVPRQIWRSLAMARALQRVSEYPLVLLSNSTTLLDGTELAHRLHRLNVQVLPVHDVLVPVSAAKKLTSNERQALWKLQIWRLTQFDKLIWLDSDAILVRSIDWLFEREPVWAQRRSRDCYSSDMAGEGLRISSGLMLVEPNEEVYDGLLAYARNAETMWWKNGHEQLIQDFFDRVVRQPLRLLETSDAAFGSCLGRVPGLPYDERGAWDLPAFVHKSSKMNECFFFDISAQQVVERGSRLNVCHYHPLGAWWRNLFCSAVHDLGIEDHEAGEFCNDATWYSDNVV